MLIILKCQNLNVIGLSVFIGVFLISKNLIRNFDMGGGLRSLVRNGQLEGRWVEHSCYIKKKVKKKKKA